MTTSLTPYLMLPGRAREALTFYASVLGGTPEILTFGAFGDPPAGVDPEAVMHGFLRTDAGLELMASEPPPEVPITPSNAITLALSGDEEGELRRWFDALSEGGEITTPLQQMGWGDTFGNFADRFGISWLVNISPSPAA